MFQLWQGGTQEYRVSEWKGGECSEKGDRGEEGIKDRGW